MPRFIGRRDAVGVGKETTPGTAVAPAAWQPHLALTLDPKTDQIQNTSAIGRREEVNDSAVVGQHAEGSINGKITDLTFGYFLVNAFGSEVSAVKETTAYNHTFTVNNNTTPPYLTIARVNPVVSRRYALARLTDLEIEVAQGDWAKFTASIMSKTGASAADTAAYTDENEFTSKHTVVKIATDTAGLAAASAVDIKSIKLKINSKAEKWIPFGAIDPTEFDLNEFSVTGEMVLRYTDTTIEALGNANTRQAMSISLINTDTTIGASSNPALVFTMPKVRLSPITLDDNLNQVINQTVNFTAEFDVAAASMISAVLTNTRSTAY
jgi:hypothetical protein